MAAAFDVYYLKILKSWKQTVDKEAFVAMSWSSYLWLNLFSENEIMHFEKSRFSGQRNIGWIWSDVSVGEPKRRKEQMN